MRPSTLGASPHTDPITVADASFDCKSDARTCNLHWSCTDARTFTRWSEFRQPKGPPPAALLDAQVARTLASASGLFLQPVDQFRRLGLGQIGRDVLPRLPSQRLEVTALWPGHRLIAGDPVFRILLGRAHRCVSHAALVPHRAVLKPVRHRTRLPATLHGAEEHRAEPRCRRSGVTHRGGASFDLHLWWKAGTSMYNVAHRQPGCRYSNSAEASQQLLSCSMSRRA
jgi:hypothetical protein